MAIFSGKVVSATFADFPTNTLIEVLYQEEDVVTAYVLEVDFTQSDFNDLLQDITLEEIEAATQTIVKAEANIFNRAINEEIERRWTLESEKIKEAYMEVEGYREKTFMEVEGYREKTLKEAQDEIRKIYAEVDKYAENEKAKKLTEVDKYAENEKAKKLTEVEEERAIRLKTLQEKYNLVSSSENITPKDLLNKIESWNNDTDFVFNTKIAILEDPIISKTKDKELKLSIRKAKSVFELLSIYSTRKLDQKD